jgi:hypothetical protein
MFLLVAAVMLAACSPAPLPAATQPPADRQPLLHDPRASDVIPTQTPQPTPEPEAYEQAEAEERAAQEQLEAERAVLRNQVLEQARWLYRGYFYEEALRLLNENAELINHETKSLEEEIQQTIDGLVLFEGEVKHIFFHSLILYPEHLFRNLSIPTGGLNAGFAFQRELIRMLPLLMERGYVLYNINDVAGKNQHGVMELKDIYLPPGKRPLILSIDDPTYHYGVGLANRMLLDEHGELVTEVITPRGETILTYDGDVQLVVDAFVRENPEFSFRGHKGIIAATGYMGIFGHRLVNGRWPDEETKQQAIAVVEKLKENGWLFANHSHTHNREGFWGPDSNAANIRHDLRRWNEVMLPVVGPTNLFIAPFGYTLRGEAMRVIIDAGYDIYCNVDFRQRITLYPDYALMGRIEIGGFSMMRYTEILNRDFFDVSLVIDAHRPPMISDPY